METDLHSFNSGGRALSQEQEGLREQVEALRLENQRLKEEIWHLKEIIRQQDKLETESREETDELNDSFNALDELFAAQ